MPNIKDIRLLDLSRDMPEIKDIGLLDLSRDMPDIKDSRVLNVPQDIPDMKDISVCCTYSASPYHSSTIRSLLCQQRISSRFNHKSL